MQFFIVLHLEGEEEGQVANRPQDDAPKYLRNMFEFEQKPRIQQTDEKSVEAQTARVLLLCTFGRLPCNFSSGNRWPNPAPRC